MILPSNPIPGSRLLKGAALGVCLLLGARTAEAQVLVDLNFNTANQFSNNFRRLNTTGTSRSTAAQTANLVRHDNQDGTTTGAGAVYIYDTTSGNGADAENAFSLSNPLSITLDFRAVAASSSIGIYFGDPNGINNNLLVLFNVDATGTTDTFRAFRDGTQSTAAAGITQVGATQNFSPSVAAANSGTFVPITFTLTVAGTTPTVSMTIGTQTLSQTYSAGDFDFAGGNATVSLRMSDSSAVPSPVSPLDIDNLQITTVPEPSAILSVFAGLALLTSTRRRRA